MPRSRPAMAEALKQYGIELPQDRVRGAVHIRQGADGSLDVRFNKANDTSEPKQAARNEGQEPATAAAVPPPPDPARPSQPPSDQARSEAPIPQEPKATAAAFDGTWSVSLTANGGFLCSRVPSQTLTVQNGGGRGGRGGGVQGRVEPRGSISLAWKKGDFRGAPP